MRILNWIVAILMLAAVISLWAMLRERYLLQQDIVTLIRDFDELKNDVKEYESYKKGMRDCEFREARPQ